MVGIAPAYNFGISWTQRHLEFTNNNYNADEFGLFYQALPTKAIELKVKKCIGGKSKNYHIFF